MVPAAGNHPNQRVFPGGTAQTRKSVANRQIFHCSVHLRCEIVVVFSCGVEGPLGDVTVKRYKKAVRIPLRIQLYDILAVKAALCSLLLHQGCAVEALRIIDDAYGRTIKAVIIVRNGNGGGIGHGNLGVILVIVICIKPDSAAAVGMLQPPVLSGMLNIKGLTAVALLQNKGRSGGICQ